MSACRFPRTRPGSVAFVGAVVVSVPALVSSVPALVVTGFALLTQRLRQFDAVGIVAPRRVERPGAVVVGERLQRHAVGPPLAERPLGLVEQRRPDSLAAPLRHHEEVADGPADGVALVVAAFQREADEADEVRVIAGVSRGLRVAGDEQVARDDRLRDPLADRRAVRLGAERGPVLPLARRERHPHVGDGVDVVGGRPLDAGIRCAHIPSSARGLLRLPTAGRAAPSGSDLATVRADRLPVGGDEVGD